MAVIDVFMYHGTPRSQAALLERQFLFLASMFEVVPLERLGEPGGRRRRVALTFDDGLRSNVTVAYPILKKLGLPATFYVCPELIDRRRWLWNHEMRARVGAMDHNAFRSLAEEHGAPAETEAFIEWMKRLDLAARLPVERAVRRATRYFISTPAQHEQFDLATWDELARLDPALVTIGSHTLTHSILTSLTEAEAQHEIAESRRRIEERLQRPATQFCYPNGDVNPFVIECTRRHYSLAVSTVPGRVEANHDPHYLPRWASPSSLARLARIVYPWPPALLGRLGERTLGRFTASLRALTWMMSRA
ncbi:MAG: polysaccharide deacetylase family protein [Betaproteobacteria bacterium]